jgi:hypothetical protein
LRRLGHGPPPRPSDGGSALSAGGAPANPPAGYDLTPNPPTGLPDNSAAATRLTPSPVPEVSGLLLLAGPVAAGWVAYWRRRWHKTPRPAAEPPNAGSSEIAV